LTYKFEVVVLLLKVAIEHDHLGQAEGHELAEHRLGNGFRDLSLRPVCFSKIWSSTPMAKEAH